MIRGFAHQSSGNYQKAIVDYQKAIYLEPDEANAHWLLGMIRAAAPDAELRDGSAALLHAESVDRQCLNQKYDINELIAAGHAAMGDFEEALKQLTIATNRGVYPKGHYDKRIEQYLNREILELDGTCIDFDANQQ